VNFGYSVIEAAALRLLLQPGARVGRLDRGLAIYLAVRTAIRAGGNFLAQEGVALPRQLNWVQGDGIALISPIMGLAGWLLAEWFSVRFMLWPIARLIGDDRVGFRFGWRAMGPATGPALTASVILAGPLLLVSLVATIVYAAGRLWGGLVAGSLAGVLAIATSLAVAAVVYRVRLGDETHVVAEVFD
jgi:hypothetical protein